MAKKRMIQRILEKSIKFKIIFSQKNQKRNEYKTKKKTDKFCIASLKKKAEKISKHPFTRSCIRMNKRRGFSFIEHNLRHFVSDFLLFGLCFNFFFYFFYFFLNFIVFH